MARKHAKKPGLSAAARRDAEGLIAQAVAESAQVLLLLEREKIEPTKTIEMALVLAAASLAQQEGIREAPFLEMVRACWEIGRQAEQGAEGEV
jgi:hypothetical protein